MLPRTVLWHGKCMFFGPITQGSGIMRKSLVIGALAAATLVTGAASATQVVVGESRLVIDVEFWGRQSFVRGDPVDPRNNIVTYGDPVHGAFRIFADDAPAPRGT